MRLFTLVILPEEMRPEIRKTMNDVYDFTDAVDAEYVPLYLINLDTKRVIDSSTEVSDFHNFYGAFVEGIQYAGVEVKEGYGIWFTPTGEVEISNEAIFDALANGLIEEAE